MSQQQTVTPSTMALSMAGAAAINRTRIKTDLVDAEDVLEHAISEALKARATWQEIGLAIGMTRGDAHIWYTRRTRRA